MTLTYRSVKGSRLTAAEFDGNTSDLDGRLVVLEAAAGSEITIEFEVLGDAFYATVNGGAQQGPFDLPVVQWNFRDEGWVAATPYLVNDVFVVDYVLYKVIFAHTSEATFDPDANNGLGDDYYEVLIDLGLAALSGVSTWEEISDSSFTAGLSHANKFMECTAVSTDVTIPTNATAPHVMNVEMHFCQVNAGSIVFSLAVGVTVDWPAGFYLETDRAGAVVTFKKLEEDRWRAYGLLALAAAEDSGT